MNEVKITYNGQEYAVPYNRESGYYEIELQAPVEGGYSNVESEFKDLLENSYSDNTKIQILAKEKIKIYSEKTFMWIFDYKDFGVVDIVEIADYEINIDEETNANTILKVLKETEAKSRDIIAIKRNNEVVYWGTINNIQNESGHKLYEYTVKYITNLFNQNIKLENEELIKTAGIEDFNENAINLNFINNTDNFINKKYLKVKTNSHTTKQVSVSNVDNGIYNFHTWMTNCTQNYNIVYDFSIENKQFVLSIENKTYKKELIDTKAQSISNYTEVFETDVVAKVVVLTSTDSLTLFLLNDRTTTTDMSNENRADGKVETVYTEKFEDAMQIALDTMKSNLYNHNITFNLLDRIIKVGTPIAIKTKKSAIYDTYISAIKITKNRFIEYICGNIRIKFIDKLLKERKN